MIKVITLVNDLPNEGGVGRVVYSLQDEFNKSKKIQNKVITVRYCDSYPLIMLKKIIGKNFTNQKKAIHKNIKCVSFKKTAISIFINRFFDKNHTNKKQLKILSRILDEEEFDIIHGHFYTVSGFFAYELAKKYEKKSIVTFHGSDTINLSKADEQIINSFDKVTFVSNFLKNTVEQKIDLTVSNEVIYNGIDTAVFHLLNRESNRNVIAYCGRLHQIKGVQHLKNVFTQLSKSLPTAEFHIYGDGVEKESLQEFFKLNDVPVQFFGSINALSLAEKFQSTKILVVPSVKEGFSCVIPEAKSCGAYVVAANVGGIPEAIGSIGTLINRDDNFETKMITEIERIWQQNAIDVEQVSQDSIYSWKDIAKQYEEVYQKLVEGETKNEE